MDELNYQRGFGNFFSTEIIEGILPAGQNSPQKLNHNLFAEQISGSSFTAPSLNNKRTWTYRSRPSVAINSFSLDISSQPFNYNIKDCGPNPLRWSPSFPKIQTNFFKSLIPLVLNGAVEQMNGSCIYLFSYQSNLESNHFAYRNDDGELLFIVQTGSCLIKTELGCLNICVGEVAIIPRGLYFSIITHSESFQGFVCENFGEPFSLPNRGAIGANGLANERDFLAPLAFIDENKSGHTIYCKSQNKLYVSYDNPSPFNVWGWHGNFYPYKYNLLNFNVLGSISFDHPDPSLFTVLTSKSNREGFANVDFVVFSPRWLVANHTFRPPYYHRNIMSEFMGNIYGEYDAKPGSGFAPGAFSLHNSMVPHGPSEEAYLSASTKELSPQFLDNTLSFMLESSLFFQVTSNASELPGMQKDYAQKCWGKFIK